MKYQRRPQPVQVVLVTQELLKDRRLWPDWLSERVAEGRGDFGFNSRGDMFLDYDPVRPGDWLVHSRHGQVEHYTNTQFHKWFEPVETNEVLA